jgi:hypothetical protein
MRPNLVHSDSKLCFPRLVHASRPPAFEFLVLFGSWEPKPLQTRFQVYPWSAQSSANTAIHGVCQHICEKREVSVNGGADITVNYRVSGFRGAAKSLKTCRKHSFWCVFVAASSWPRGGHDGATTRPRRGHDEATTRPRRGHDEATTRPRGGHDEATTRPRRGHEEATTRPRRGHDEATRRPRRGHDEATRRPRGGHDEATTRPRRGHEEATRKLRGGDDEATTRPRRHMEGFPGFGG